VLATTSFRRFLCLFGLSCLTVQFGAAAVSASEAPEQKRLLALLVIDTNSNLAESVACDLHTMECLLRNNIPEGRLEVKILKKDEVTREKILDHYKKLDVKPTDALLFFYAGHGATDPDLGHCLVLQHSNDKQERKYRLLARRELRDVMQEKQPGLVVILTDCCSNIVRLKESKRPVSEFVTPKVVTPVVRNLLFQHRGIVDISASTNEPSWGDDRQGGLFTRSLRATMESKVADLDANKDGFVTWAECFPVLSKKTNEEYLRYKSEHMRSEDGKDLAKQKEQLPRVYRLLPDAPLGKQGSWAVVSLTNRTKDPVSFKYRWAGNTEWTEEMLPKGEKTTISLPLAGGAGQVPVLELLEKSEKQSQKLEAKRWEGTGHPGFNQGMKYSFKP
jgi:Caspase domain